MLKKIFFTIIVSFSVIVLSACFPMSSFSDRDSSQQEKQANKDYKIPQPEYKDYIFDAEIGQCLRAEYFSEVITPEKYYSGEKIDQNNITDDVFFQDCYIAYHAQVFDRIPIEPAEGGSYPGEEAVIKFAYENCSVSLQETLGSEASEMFFYTFHFPTQVDWDNNIKDIVCLVHSSNYVNLLGPVAYALESQKQLS